MSNIQKLATDGNQNHKIFASTIVNLMTSQGFYGRLYKGINDMDEENYKLLFETLAKQNFNDSLDVVLWLES